ncbi:MAG: hypothetical protein IKL06_03645 [Lachnospiraceae bacterium]|nr:hypothetical protein [Lachnospiraceae bacterium]
MEKIGVNDGGTLSQSLNALISSDFVVKYIPFGKGKKEHSLWVNKVCGNRT